MWYWLAFLNKVSNFSPTLFWFCGLFRSLYDSRTLNAMVLRILDWSGTEKDGLNQVQVKRIQNHTTIRFINLKKKKFVYICFTSFLKLKKCCRQKIQIFAFFKNILHILNFRKITWEICRSLSGTLPNLYYTNKHNIEWWMCM